MLIEFNGAPAGIIAVHDITQRKQAEASLRASEERFSNMAESIQEGLAIVENGELVYFNNRVCDILGCSREELPQFSNFDFIDPQDRERVRHIAEKARTTGCMPTTLEYWIVRKDGTRRCVQNRYTVKEWSDGLISRYVVTSDITERKKAEEALQQERERLARIIMTSPIVICSIAADGTANFINKTGEEVTGYSLEELKGLNWWGTFYPGELHGQVEELFRNFAWGDVVNHEMILQTKSGAQRTILWNSLTDHDDDGNITEMFGFGNDITQLRQADRERELNAQCLQVLLNLNQMRDVTLKEITDFALEEAVRLTQSTIGYLAFLNEDESVLTMHSWSKSAMNQCAIEDKPLIYPVESTGLWGEAVRQRQPIITNNYTGAGPLMKGYPEGHVAIRRHMNIPVFDGARIVLVAGLGNKAEDYTEDDVRQLTVLMEGMWRLIERKNAENEVRRARDYFETIFRASPDAIYVTNAEGYIVKANESFYSVYGYHPEEIIGQHAAVLTPEDEKAMQASVALMEELFEKGIVRGYVGQRQRKDGCIIQVESSAVLLKNPDGTPSGAISSSRDITDRRRLEEQLRQSQKMEAVGTLAGGIAHDFNNILGVIFGYAELSQDLAAGNSMLENNLDQILKAADRAKDLVSQILAFSRKSESDVKPLRAHLVIKEALKLLRASLPATISILTDIDGTHDIVVADATQLHQIIMNLCTNAAYAMHQNGGTLDVKLQPVDLDQYSATSYNGITAGPYVQLSVKDTGTGIPADIINRIFEPFFTTKDVGKGTGMGLSVVHGIVKSLRGDIKVYSDPGMGSIFHVLLPRVQDAPPDLHAHVDPPPHGHESVLLVDDEQVLLDVGTHMLESLGYRVTALQSPLEAFETFRKNSAGFDLVITDQTMPGLTGYDLAQRVRERRADMPIILCTGYSDLVTAESALAAGIRAFVIKPLNRLSIAETIRQALDKSVS
jgi:PAS domain S-box-containing protein